MHRQEKWISANEKLPENKQSVFVCMKRRDRNDSPWIVVSAFYSNGTECETRKADIIIPKGWWRDYGGVIESIRDDVLYWTPVL